MKVLIMSDTHGLLRPQVREMIGDCDAVIHGGDFHVQGIADEIRDLVPAEVPVFFVRGNNDGRWASYIPDHLEFTLEGVKFYVVHDKKDIPGNLRDCQVVIFGHSHKYSEEWKDGRLYLNPGSCGKRRFRLGITMAVLYLEKGEISVERIDISDGIVKDSRTMELQGNLLGVIRDIMKRMDKGHQVERISKELKLEQEFVEDICRIRVTHPGVSAEGILDKVEANKSKH